MSASRLGRLPVLAGDVHHQPVEVLRGVREERACVEAVAAAVRRRLEPGTDDFRTPDQLVDFGELPLCQLLELVVRRLAFVAGLEEDADVVE
jgi:hypothetical protein